MLAIGTAVSASRDHNIVPVTPSASAAPGACTPSGSESKKGNEIRGAAAAGATATPCPTTTTNAPTTTACNNRANVRMAAFCLPPPPTSGIWPPSHARGSRVRRSRRPYNLPAATS
ncbi:hypothetical protein GCM10027167_58070 [Nocardia heshunensis]